MVHREHAHVAVAVAEVAVHQAPHRLVWNAEPRAAVHHIADRKQSKAVQQREEVFALTELIHWETHAQIRIHPAFGNHLAQHIEVAVGAEGPRGVQLGAVRDPARCVRADLCRGVRRPFGGKRGVAVHHHQMAQLHIVNADVRVDEVARAASVGYGVLQVVQHHVRVVHVLFGIFRETVAVVPLAHQRHGRIGVFVENTQASIHLHQRTHFRFGEAHHILVLGIEADVGADVETAGHVVHGHWRDAGDEQPLQTAGLRARLQGGEEVPKEAAAVCH